MALDFPKPYPMDRWTDEEWRRMHPIFDGFEAFGYWVAAEPLEGMFDQWCDGLMQGLRDVESKADEIRKVWGYRGRSKNLIDRLHQVMPEPVWGVDVRP